MKIYLKNYKKNKKETVLSLIKYFLDKNNDLKTNDIWINIMYSLETFKDKNSLITQCKKTKRRSFDDILFLCKTYFPNVTDKKVAKELENFFKDNKNRSFSFFICPNIKNWVLIPNGSHVGFKYCNTCFDSNFRVNEKSEGKYSLSEILELMGYKKNKQKV